MQRRAEEDLQQPRGDPASDKRPSTTDRPQKSGARAGPVAPVLSLPKGGGAIRSIGEKFSTNPVTGTAQIQIPVAVSPGRAGFQPDLALAYDSGAGNGPFGHGFQVSVPQIARKTDKGLPTYDDARDSDTFLLSGAEDLVPKRLEDAAWERERFDDDHDFVQRYVTRIEGLFARIEKREDKATGMVYWQVTTTDNVTSTYGRSDNARIADPEHPRRVFSWLLEDRRDDRGNVTVYRYKDENAVNVSRVAPCEANRHAGEARIVNRYLKSIRFGNTVSFDATPGLDSAVFEVVFDYGEHDTDTIAEAREWPCRRDPFSTYRAGFEVRTYRLCRRILMFHLMTELGDTPYLVRSTDLTYAENPDLTKLIAVTHTGYIRDPVTRTYLKKSLPAVELGYSPAEFQTDAQSLGPASMADLPASVQGAYQWIDLDGEALPGVLSQQAGAFFYKQNLGGDLAPARLLLRQPSLARLGSGAQQIADLDGDGRKELAIFTPPEAGYFDRTEGGDFEPFRLFPAQALIDWNDPNLRHIDLNGDGYEDVLIARAESFTWYPSLAKDGFASPITFNRPRDDEKGAALVFADGTQTIFLADMSGDGLTDLVRIRNGSLCYWPNLGYGGFGAKVQMGGETWFDHPERFDPRRIRLADVDGSGTTDILYLHEDGVRIYKNEAGNNVAPWEQLPRFPDASDLSSVATVDLLGSGTACLVWSSSLPGPAFRSIRYVDLLGSKKPHLLTSYKNNLGLEATLDYASSTRFYLEDAARGRPWITRLHFPVQVLTRVETNDTVSRHRFVSTYAYHHGYFDGVEREFRGFGMVEQWDTEHFSRFSGMGQPPPANAADPELHSPPVHVKTWFHTGARAPKIAHAYTQEYYAGDAQAVLLPDTVLPASFSGDEVREACRALKGQILRQETYADDGSPHPYLVSERSYDIRRLQPVSGERHGVFFVHPREAIEYHYERNPADPRITHAFILEVDAFGTVRRSAAVGYPRRAASAAFDEQTKLAITLTEVDVVHHAPRSAAGYYRVAVPIEQRTYELTGVSPAPDALLSFDPALDAVNRAVAIPYETAPDGSLQKRLLSQSKTRYWRDDLSAPAPDGAIESLALPFQSYSKAFTPALVADALQGRSTDDILLEGGYVKLAGEDDWWVPSARQIFDRDRFCLPISFLDPFGNATSIAYDRYLLAVEKAIDPVGNAVSATYDYRVLAPRQVTDPNGAGAVARFDVLGMVEATALIGAQGEGDTLDDPTATFTYDLDRRPVVVHGRMRERHGAANTLWQEHYSYSDGSGREVMRKVQAEPDASGPRWIGTGRTVFDNKGNPVKQYEPYFSPTFEYEDEPAIVERGVTPILRYDPIGRLVRMDLPNGSFSTVTFDPWKETRSDPNDNVLESAWYRDRQAPEAPAEERRAATLAAAHAQTPAVAHLDALGRPFLTIEDNGPKGTYETRVALDIEGQPLTITDARGLVAMRHRFGMGGQKLWQKSCDAGERWMVADVGGALLRAWDSRGFTRHVRFDVLRRPTHVFVRPANGPEFLAERTIYGEALGDAAPTAYHRGRIYQHYDGAGVATNLRYDFKGNLENSERRLAREYRAEVDWTAIGGLEIPDEISSAANELLDARTFGASTAYDALNRPTSLIAPDLSEIEPTYNEASLLDKVRVRVRNAAEWTTFVDGIDYDARRQRERIVYGGVAGRRVTTAYSHDRFTFRLTHLATSRELDARLLQNLSYTYDPAANITEIRDEAQQTVFFDNAVVTPSTAYEYDAIYRLTRATGRELAGGAADAQPTDVDLSPQNIPHANNLEAVRNYVETYEYDPVGNILTMAHGGGTEASKWTRRYDIDDASNRLKGTSANSNEQKPYSQKYEYDAHGNMIVMPHLPAITWDHADRMLSAEQGGGGIVYFTYDAAGQRVRKVWRHSGLIEERIYLGGYEVYRRYADSDAGLTEPTFERQTLQVMDGERRIALVETSTVDARQGGAFQPSTVIRFQLGNHLGSAALEVDDVGHVISYEEYHPYGTTAYSSATGAAEVSPKRYRYTGKEKDEETGLYYHGARYYAPWLARWTSADSAGLVDGPDLYAYTRNNPIRLVDLNGQEAQIKDPDMVCPLDPACPPSPGLALRNPLPDAVVLAEQQWPSPSSPAVIASLKRPLGFEHLKTEIVPPSALDRYEVPAEQTPQKPSYSYTPTSPVSQADPPDKLPNAPEYTTNRPGSAGDVLGAVAEVPDVKKRIDSMGKSVERDLKIAERELVVRRDNENKDVNVPKTILALAPIIVIGGVIVAGMGAGGLELSRKQSPAEPFNAGVLLLAPTLVPIPFKLEERVAVPGLPGRSMPTWSMKGGVDIKYNQPDPTAFPKANAGAPFPDPTGLILGVKVKGKF